MDKNIIRITFELSRSTKGSQSLKQGNEMINVNDRLHYQIRKELTAHLRQLSNLKAKEIAGNLPDGTYWYGKERPCFLVIKISSPSDRRMDTPNWYPTVKALVDGLTDANIFEDDNDDVITSFTFLRGPKTGNKKYQITIEIWSGNIM